MSHKSIKDIVIDDLKITLEVDGQEYEAVPATPDEVAELEKAGFTGCNCGQQICYNTYVWVCRYRRPDCYWYRTNVRCNEN